MAVRFPVIPSALIGNKIYLYMLRTYIGGLNETWHVDELLHVGSPDDLRAVLDFQAGVQRKDVIKPAFAVDNTLSNMIVTQTRHHLMVFKELHKRLPKESKCDAGRLKDLVSYLTNFNLIQYVHLPASGVTVITGDHADRDPDLDWIFSLSDITDI